MADEFPAGTNWWDSSRNSLGGCSINSFGWPSEMVDVKGGEGARSSMESGSVVVSDGLCDTQKHQHVHDSSAAAASDHLNMMGLCLSSSSSSSQAMDWSHALLVSGDKDDQGSFHPMLQENLNSSSSYEQESCDFQTDSSAVIYGSPSSCTFQRLLGSDDHDHDINLQVEKSLVSYSYGAVANYGLSSNDLLPSWSKVPYQFLRNSTMNSHSHLHFSNNAPFWNASATSAMTDVRPSFLSSSRPQFPPSSFDEKPKINISDVRDLSASSMKKNGSEGGGGGGAVATKRPRNETTPLLPAFKVRKEKMGDRITALQQLVSPFGKTDTASVLSEAIEYIKILHEQVTALSNPYMKIGTSMHCQQGFDKSKDLEEYKQDLRSRGLCLVPVSSTFPMTHETTVDSWTPTFGGNFR